MATYLLAVPLAPGKTEAWKKYNQEMEGPRKEEYANYHKRLGIKIEQVYLQQTPMGDMVLVRWETDNPQKIFDAFKSSQEPFDKWFREKVMIECHNMDPAGPMPKLTQVHDYHESLSREYADTGKKH
jgi:hypothetical protein